jgi:hypothetical protein
MRERYSTRGLSSIIGAGILAIASQVSYGGDWASTALELERIKNDPHMSHRDKGNASLGAYNRTFRENLQEDEARRNAEAQKKRDEELKRLIQERARIERETTKVQPERSESSTEKIPSFFTCNYCGDFDNDGYIWGRSEYVGIKNRFARGEKMCIIGCFENTRKGQRYTRRIIGPDGKEFDTCSDNALGDNFVVGASNDANEARRFADAKEGWYVVAWYLDGKYLGSSQFELSGDTEENRKKRTVENLADLKIALGEIDAKIKILEAEEIDEERLRNLEYYKELIKIREKIQNKLKSYLH